SGGEFIATARWAMNSPPEIKAWASNSPTTNSELPTAQLPLRAGGWLGRRRHGPRRLGRGRRRGRRSGRLGRLVRLGDDVLRDVVGLVHQERDLAREEDVDPLLLRHRVDGRLELLLELRVHGLGLGLRALLHALEVGLAVLEEGLAVA